MTTTYRLQSNAAVAAPGVVRWAINGYHFEDDRPAILKVMTAWDVPQAATHALLSQAVPFTIEGETVVFSVEDEQ